MSRQPFIRSANDARPAEPSRGRRVCRRSSLNATTRAAHSPSCAARRHAAPHEPTTIHTHKRPRPFGFDRLRTRTPTGLPRVVYRCMARWKRGARPVQSCSQDGVPWQAHAEYKDWVATNCFALIARASTAACERRVASTLLPPCPQNLHGSTLAGRVITRTRTRRTRVPVPVALGAQTLRRGIHGSSGPRRGSATTCPRPSPRRSRSRR